MHMHLQDIFFQNHQPPPPPPPPSEVEWSAPKLMRVHNRVLRWRVPAVFSF